ncbi:Nucleic-acid-binding protein from transposon X-element [Eumeta japonica]|uniref:Nucleic-acid-binding protein from transposon X-element n=1 Tax=Eumeta variegata TaxID=151549 RepID=A0A4C1T391_EUMVA|nr:Nucleic-acid-binding protein from transposon X-element [Eumeta japonica]
MDDNRLKQFLKERGLLDLLRDFETYFSPASPVQPDPDLEMEVENLAKKEPNKRPAAARPSEGSTSDSDTSRSDDSDHSDLADSTEFTTVRRRKASRPKTAISYLTQAGDGSSYYRITPSSKKPKKANSKSKPSTPVKSTQSIYDAPESWRKTIQPTKATAPTVTLHEADEIVPPAPTKPQRPPPLFIHDKGRWTEIKKQCNTKGIVILNGRNSVKGLKIQPESDEREFRFVLRRVPKEIPIEEVKEDLLTQDLPVQSVRRITNRAREPLDLVLVTANTGIDYETKRSFYRIKAVCSLSGCPRAPKRNTTQKNKTPPPPAQAAPRRGPARAVTQKLSYAKATAGPRTDPPLQSKINPTPSENIKALMSVISIIDIGKSRGRVSFVREDFYTSCAANQKIGSDSRGPISAPNGRATASRKYSVCPDQCFHLCVVCVQVCAEPHREVHSDELRHLHRAGPRASTLAATAMDSHRMKQFLAERGLLDLLRDFEAYCSSPASPEQPDPELEMEVEHIPKKEPNKRSAAVRPSEGFTSDSDAGWSDDSDNSDFTTVRHRKASRSKPEVSYLRRATDGSTYYRITPSSKKAEKGQYKDTIHSCQLDPAPTAPTVTLDEADDIVPHPEKPQRPPPLFIYDKRRWSEIRKQCDSKGIVILHGRNSNKGLKIQPASVTDYRNLSALLTTLKVAYHTYSLKEEREIRVVLREVPKEIPIEEVKEDLLAQDLPVQSVRRITNCVREPLDLVLVTANTGIDTATKRAYRTKAVCSLSGIKVEQPHKKSIPGQCFNCQLYGHSSKNCFQRARCLKCLGDHGTAACTRNKDTDGPPACVLCKSSGHTANYLGCPRAPKRKILQNNKIPPPPTQAAPRRGPARAVTRNISYTKATAGPRKDPPTKTNTAPSENIKALMSVISIIDIGEVVLLANKFKAAANPVEKKLILAEHAVEAIKNNKI